MNNHIYSTLFKTQERESDRRSKEIEQRKESQKHTRKKKQGHVTLSKFPSNLNGLENFFFNDLIIICVKIG